MRRVNKIRFKTPSTAAKFEFDPGVGAWYIRFRNAKVAKTISEEKPGMVMAMDLDAHGELIGIELLGAKEFSIGQFKKIAPFDTSKVDFDRAKFSAVSRRGLVGA
jgi:uncharacterized protein YuzE